ncbi:hypothetical protein SDC9_40910 [bioreactor metagenome]|jgi:Uncharacterized conserved protein containing a ferredoxin-like domain|uniref:LUD domain-containing protein n=1 Tax=bioreactor metagenome TaxID=1076179 RepID=A0A644VTL3_9ZZZZ|nr:lactate utilization protein [Acidaminococcaceae bacterium]
MSEIEKKHLEALGKQAVKALNAKRFIAQFAATKEEAVQAILSLIKDKDTVGMGGSETTEELKLKSELEKRGNIIYYHQGLPPEESRIMRCKELTADVFLTSTNAVTLEGELINVDGSGNRVAAMSFGPKLVIVVVGANKIVQDEAAGRKRIKLQAAPMNATRLSCKTPCVSTGICMDCNSPERICMITSILHMAPRGSDFHIIVVGETLGY